MLLLHQLQKSQQFNSRQIILTHMTAGTHCYQEVVFGVQQTPEFLAAAVCSFSSTLV
jgi:hypothetical protein